jgi:hypothetical protein
VLIFSLAADLATSESRNNHAPHKVVAAAADQQSGTWKMNPAKSKYSPGPTPKSVTVKVDADQNNVKVNADGINADGTPTHVEYSATFDGKDYPIIGTYADMASVKRIDANTMQSTLKSKGGQVMMTVTTTVSADGKTRTSTFKGTDGQGHDINNIVVYDKE